MKNNYSIKRIQFLLLSVCLLTPLKMLGADTPADVYLKSLSVQNEASGLVASYQSGDTDLSLYVKNGTSSVLSYGDFSCLNISSPDNYPYLFLSNDEVSGNGQLSSYLELKNDGARGIKRIEYVGFSQGGNGYSNLLCSVSFDGETYLDISYTDTEADIYGQYQPVVKELFLIDYSSACDISSDYSSYAIPEGLIKDRGLSGETEITGVRSKVKSIRLNWSDAPFGNFQTSRGDVPEIAGLRIFMDDFAVGVGTDKEETYELTQKGTLINAGELSDFMVYNLSGMCVLNETNTESVDLSVLPNGLYIVKAISNESGESGTLKVLLKN